jgi:hypothetical protein
MLHHMTITPIEKTLAAIEEAESQKEAKRVESANNKLPQLLDNISKAASQGETLITWERDMMTPAIKSKLEHAGYCVDDGPYYEYILIHFKSDYREKPKTEQPAPKKSFFQYLTDTDTGAFSGWSGGFVLGFCTMGALSIAASLLRIYGVI